MPGEFENSLDIDYQRAFRIVMELLNVSQFAKPLMEDHFILEVCRPGDAYCRTILNSFCDEIPELGVPFEAKELPSAKDAADATAMIGVLAGSFFNCINSLYGYDTEESLRMLLRTFDPAPGWTRREILETIDVGAAVAAITFSLLAFIPSGGTSTAGVIQGLAFLSIGIGAGSSGYLIIDDWMKGEISFDEMVTRISFVAAFSILGVAPGFKSYAEIERVIAAGGPDAARALLTKRFIDALGGITFETGTGLAVGDHFDSDFDAIINAMAEEYGVDPNLIRNNISDMISQQQALEAAKEQFEIDIPAGTTVYNVPASHKPEDWLAARLLDFQENSGGYSSFGEYLVNLYAGRIPQRVRDYLVGPPPPPDQTTTASPVNLELEEQELIDAADAFKPPIPQAPPAVPVPGNPNYPG